MTIILMPTILLLASTAAVAEGDSWVDRVAFKGDFRLRYEVVDLEGVAKLDRDRKSVV